MSESFLIYRVETYGNTCRAVRPLAPLNDFTMIIKPGDGGAFAGPEPEVIDFPAGAETPVDQFKKITDALPAECRITLRFLLSYGGETISPGISVSKYLSLVLGLAAACGVMFELPVVTMVLHRLDFLSIAFMTQNRRYAVLLAAVATAILTPTPDAFTMTMLLVPLLMLYEISILVLRVVERRTVAEDE